MAVIENCGVTLVKRFTYRGDTQETWSNHYWLSGSPPSTEALWGDLFDELATIEAACYASTSKVVTAYGYSTSDTDPLENTNSVAVKHYDQLAAEIPGRLTGTPTERFAGDQAGLIRWATARRDSKGKLVRLRKYMHDGFTSSTDPDSISVATGDAYQAFTTQLQTGNWLGARRIQSHRGAETIQGGAPSGFVTTRTLKRRGKRPKVA